MGDEGSTIHVSREVKKALDRLKVHHREAYDEVLRRILKLPDEVPK